MIARYDTKTIVIAIAALIVAVALLSWGYSAHKKSGASKTIHALVTDTSARLRDALESEAAPAPKKPAKPKPVSRKPLEARIRRLEELMARLAAQRADIEARLGDPAIYADERKGELEALLLDQAYVGKELAQLEAEWLALHEQLEATT